MNTRFKVVAALALATAVACGPTNTIPAASINNIVDTVTLGAIVGTPLTIPSGYSVALARPIRTDIESNFDFVFSLDTLDLPVFLTTQVLRMASASPLRPGFIESTVPFDSMVSAPLNGYITNRPFSAARGKTYYMRSSLVCTSLSSALYGKLEVIDYDPVNREVIFRALVNSNCGYHSLRPGRPTY
jgi:hypothetical protein